MTRYRRAVLLLGAAGAVTAGVVAMLPWAAAVAAAAALLLAATTPTARPAAAVGGLVLLVVGFTSYATPPLVAGVLLLLLLLVLATREPRQQELDAGLIAATGVAVVAASTAVGWSPVLPMVGCSILLASALWHRQRATAGHDVLRPQQAAPRVLLAAVAAVGALTMLALPTTGAIGLQSTLFGRHGHGTGTSQQDLDPASFSTDVLQLSVRGQLSDAPILSVTAAAPQLWRGDVYQTYTGSTWLVPNVATSQRPLTQGDDSAQPVAGDGIDPLPPGRAVTVEASPVGDWDGTLYAPGVVTAVRAPGRLYRTSAGASRLIPGGAPYAIRVVLPVTDPARLAAASGADPTGWTQLPTELPQRVRALAQQITADAQTRPAKVAAVEDYLRSHERYTLTAPVPAAGHDAVDDMLFRTHEGFCEQLASAEVVLLRSVGIPARLATGFAYGSVEGSSRTFTGGDAHAWVEVSYPGLGWSTSDPTAGVPLAGPQVGVLGHLRAALAWVGRSNAHRAGAAGVLVVLLLVGTLATGRARTSVGRRRRRGTGPVSTAFERLERRLPRAPSTTPREYVATTGLDLDAALTAWEAELFAPVAPGPQQTREAVRAVRAVTRRPVRRSGSTSPSSPDRP
jgi:transglutaminase-like putative cysteine protease